MSELNTFFSIVSVSCLSVKILEGREEQGGCVLVFFCSPNLSRPKFRKVRLMTEKTLGNTWQIAESFIQECLHIPNLLS